MSLPGMREGLANGSLKSHITVVYVFYLDVVLDSVESIH